MQRLLELEMELLHQSSSNLCIVHFAGVKV